MTFDSIHQCTVMMLVHMSVILYNYYHRKQFPHLPFVDAKRFLECSSLTVGETLLAYSNMVHKHEKSSGEAEALSLTDKAALDACKIAEALDATKDSPDMAMWPISKVAVLLLDLTRKRCLIENGFVNKGVRAFLEKGIGSSIIDEHNSLQPGGQNLKNNVAPHPLDGPYSLQKLAFSEVERRTGIARSSLRLLDEHLAYSLTKRATTTKLFIVQYEQTAKGNFVEMPLEELINSITGPIVQKHPYPTTTCVVDLYHILPYKDVLFDCLHRQWPFDSSLSISKEQAQPNVIRSAHSEIDENLKEQEANSKSKMQKSSTKGSTQKKNKQEVKAEASNGKKTYSSTNKSTKSNSKRKSEVFRTTAAECAVGWDNERSGIKNELPSVVDVKPVKFLTNSVKEEETAATREGSVDIIAGVQMEKKSTKKHSLCINVSQDVALVKAPDVALVIKNSALKMQSVEESEKSGGITMDRNNQMYASWKSLLLKRDELHRKQRIIEDESVQCDMDIQRILSEGDITPEAMLLVLQKYEDGDNSSDTAEIVDSSHSGYGYPTLTMKRKKLTVETLLRNKCQELDEVCRENNWTLPRYKVNPSLANGMYQANVDVTCLEFNLIAYGDPKMTAREARDSAAANMIHELFKKAGENQPVRTPIYTPKTGVQQVTGKFARQH
ncbi:hypothetical protein GUJ93_ZPchr0002g25186 [Zizania palustris]|uniref:DRBM domain-containing protein n=2 Tax=Zizania palustris TaxID=103762 RepID=A0A8J5V3R3_ZIZPA|nr:hypothetical protein GUJ93_ZPchr0002g25186 [Zizania palustris]